MTAQHPQKMPWRTLRFRLLLLFTLLSATITSVFTAYYIIHQNSSSTEQLQHEGQLILTLLKNTLRLPLYAEYREGIASGIAEVIDNNSLLSVKVFNQKNVLLAEVHKNKKSSQQQMLTIREPVTILERNYSPESLLLGTESDRSATIGFIEIALDKTIVAKQLRSLYQAALLIGFTFWASTTLIGYFLLKKITAPFQNLLKAIKQIENGNLSLDIQTTDVDETGQAAKAVNDLATALREREEENKRLNDELVRSMRIEVREEKKKMMAKLINTNRMTSLGLLVSSMAHEINNPNGSIRLSNEYLTNVMKSIIPILDEVKRKNGELEILGMTFEETRNELQNACDNISRSTVRIEQVIANLRSYSLGERLQMDSDIDMNSVIENAISIFRSHGRRHDVTLISDLAANLPTVSGNATQLLQVVLNLVMNATQALTDERNNISVRTNWEWQTGTVILTVTDEGKGIPPENMKRLFDPFFSTRLEEGGSGLGLYISKFIVEEHGGKIAVNSKLGKGSTFTIMLPAKPPRTGLEPL